MATTIGPAEPVTGVGGAPAPPEPPGGVRRVAARHPVIAFFALAYLLSWPLWGIAALGGGQIPFLLGGLGPLVSAIVITTLSGRSVRSWVRSLLVWRVSPAYYAVALVLPVVIYAEINLILVLLGGELDLSQLVTLAPSYLGMFLMAGTIGGGLEEPGWRGFALPRMESRHSPLVSTVVVGLAWGLWHVPLYGPAGFVVPLVLAFFYTWIYNRTGSVLLCLLLHAGFTPAQNLLTLASPPGGGEGGASTDAVILGVYVVAALALTLVTGGRLGLRRAPRPAGARL